MSMPSPFQRWFGVAAAVAVAGCGDSRPAQTGEPAIWTTYPEVSSLLSQHCGGSCHSGASPSASYSVDSYLSVVSKRDDGTPRAAPGDPNALLLMAAAGTLSPHPTLPMPLSMDQLAQLDDWVVPNRVAKEQYTIHFKGWMDPADTDQFHGLVLRKQGYQTDSCTACHGDDLHGGTSHVDCNSCHAAGVFACNTCHGDSVSPSPPRDLHGVRITSALSVGAHRSHVLAGRLHTAYECTACHPNPTVPEHFATYGSTEPPAPVVLRSAPPPSSATWDRTVGTCSNAYCHEPSGPSDTAPTNPSPHWTNVGAGEAGCGTCHGLPPSSHVDDRCPACHQATYSAGQLLAAKHANGMVDLGNGPAGCANCHGDASSPAPPTDVLGRSDESLPSVGAHRAHLEAQHQLRGPIPCTECHLVPSSLHDPGHIDHPPPAIVFPNLPGVGVLARTDGAQPSYNPAGATCGSVYCHGGGARLMTDTAPGIRAPVWTGGISQAACGACHGIAPQDGFPGHVGATLTQCHNCHAQTVTSSGAIIVDRDLVTGELRSKHINGMVEVGGP